MEEIIKKIKKLDQIKPGSDFTMRSKALILTAPQNSAFSIFEVFQNPIVRVPFVLAGISALVVLGGYFKSTPAELAGLDQKSIKAEAEEIGIQIQLEKISYYENTSKNTDVALKETAQTGPGSLSQFILNKEATNLDISTTTMRQKNIDSVLKELSK